MINMMYLVLTAMLALNVDSAVIERFININTTLESQMQENVKRNDNTIQGIFGAVEEKGNRPDDIKVLDKAKQVRDETNRVLGTVNRMKEEIVALSGGIDESGNLVGAKDMDKLATYMIRQKRGDTLQNVLNNYAGFLSGLTNLEFAPIALDGKDDPYFSTRPNQRSKDFKELIFEMTPTAGGLASISQLMNKVVDYETNALSKLAEQVGAKDQSFDRIYPMVMPESKIVAAGAKYSAKMFIAASASGITPTMRMNGTSLPVGPDGIGMVEFTATGGTYDADDRVRKTFTAEIDLGDSTYRQEIEYFVAKPVIQIQSASVQALYRNCGNKLDVRVPALGAAYNPSFTVKGGTSIGGRGGQVTIVPTAPTCELSVYSSGNFIGTTEFRVRPIPRPDIVMKANGAAVDEKRGLQQVPRTVSLDAVADEDFRSFLPDDARYRVTQWEITLARGPRPIQQMQVNGPEANISGWIPQARPGDRIVIEIKQVQRMNFQRETEDVQINLGSRVKQIPIVSN